MGLLGLLGWVRVGRTYVDRDHHSLVLSLAGPWRGDLVFFWSFSFLLDVSSYLFWVFMIWFGRTFVVYIMYSIGCIRKGNSPSRREITPHKGQFRESRILLSDSAISRG